MHPVIPTCKAKAGKVECNARGFIHANRTCTDNTHNVCPITECYVCSNPCCNTRIFKRCYSGLPTNTKPIIDPKHYRLIDKEDLDQAIPSAPQSDAGNASINNSGDGGDRIRGTEGTFA